MSESLSLGSAKCSKLTVDDGVFSMKVSFTTGALPEGTAGLTSLIRVLNEEVSIDITPKQRELFVEQKKETADGKKTKPEEVKAPVVVIDGADRRKEIEGTLSSTAIRDGRIKGVFEHRGLQFVALTAEYADEKSKHKGAVDFTAHEVIPESNYS